MALLKVWVGAFAALIVFLCLQAVLQQQSEQIGRIPIVRKV